MNNETQNTETANTEDVYSDNIRLACYTALYAAQEDELALLTKTQIEELLALELLTVVESSKEDPSADFTYELTDLGETLAQDYLEKLTQEKLETLEAQLATAVETLQLIAQYGSTEIETEDGTLSCNGTWCATQAQIALNSIAEHEDNETQEL